jgi:hypothetical protein
MGQISGTWELLLHEYWRKNMIIDGKKDLAFWHKLGEFIETKAINVPIKKYNTGFIQELKVDTV